MARLEKVTAFRAAYPKVRVQTNPVTGVPEDLWGDLSKNQTKTDPVEATFEFYEQNKQLYGISNPQEELKVKEILRHELGTTVVLIQLYKGVELYHSKVPVQFSRSGKLNGVNGGFAQIQELSITPSIDSNSAIEIVKRDLEFPPGLDYGLVELERFGRRQPKGRPPLTRLAIFSHRGKYHLVWVARLLGYKTDSDWEYFIDAHTGDILDKQDLIVPFLPGPKPERKTPIVPPRNLEDSKPASNEKVETKSESGPSPFIVIPAESYKQVPTYQLDCNESYFGRHRLSSC